MKATLSNFKQSPRKVRLVADAIRGKRVSVARDHLTFLAKKSSPTLKKLLESAIANAAEQGMNADDLIVKTITVDKGMTLRRFMPKARGRAGRIHRERSIVKLELGTVGGAAAKNAKKVTTDDTKETTAAKPAAKAAPRVKKTAKKAVKK